MEKEVTIVDIKMPFLSMVVFMVKLAIAALPAAIIVVLFFTLLAGLLGVPGRL